MSSTISQRFLENLANGYPVDGSDLDRAEHGRRALVQTLGAVGPLEQPDLAALSALRDRFTRRGTNGAALHAELTLLMAEQGLQVSRSQLQEAVQFARAVEEHGTSVPSLAALEALASAAPSEVGFERKGSVKIDRLASYENNRLNDIAIALRRAGEGDGGAHAFFFDRAKAIIVGEPVAGSGAPVTRDFNETYSLGERDQELLLSLHRAATEKKEPQNGVNEGVRWRVIPLETTSLESISGRFNDFAYYLRQAAVDSGETKAAIFELANAAISARTVDGTATRPTVRSAEVDQDFLVSLYQRAKDGSGFATGVHDGIEWKLSLV